MKNRDAFTMDAIDIVADQLDQVTGHKDIVYHRGLG